LDILGEVSGFEMLIVNSLRLHLDENEAKFSAVPFWRRGELNANLQGNRTSNLKFEKTIYPISRHEMTAWQSNFWRIWISNVHLIQIRGQVAAASSLAKFLFGPIQNSLGDGASRLRPN
jgi:hypothetical protein